MVRHQQKESSQQQARILNHQKQQLKEHKEVQRLQQKQKDIHSSFLIVLIISKIIINTQFEIELNVELKERRYGTQGNTKSFYTDTQIAETNPKRAKAF